MTDTRTKPRLSPDGRGRPNTPSPRLSMLRRCTIGSVLLASVATTGCVTTSMGSVVAPQGVTTYHRVVVDFSLNDLGLRMKVERRFQETYEYYEQLAGVAALTADSLFVPSHALLFPATTYSPQQVDSIVAARHVEAILIVSLGEGGAERGYFAGMTANCTQWTYSQCSGVTASSYGTEYTKPWTGYDVRLFDVRTREVVWVGSGSSRGNAFTTGEDLARSIVDKAVEQLIKDGIVPKPGSNN